MPSASEVWGGLSVPGYAGGQFYLPGSVADPGMTPLIPTNGGSGIFDPKEVPGPSQGGIVYNSWYAVPFDAIRLVKPYLVFFTQAQLSDGYGGWVALDDDEIRGVGFFDFSTGPYQVKLTPNTYAALVGLKIIAGPNNLNQIANIAAQAQTTQQIEAVSEGIGKIGGLAILAAIAVGAFIVLRKV